MARKTKEDAEKTRCQILDAAEMLFQAQGVSRTSLQTIASQAGITRGAIYWHFKDKGDLFNALVDRTIWPMERACQESGSDAAIANDPNPVASLRQHQLEAMHTIAHNPRVRRMLEIAIYQVELTDDMKVVRDKVFESQENFYERNRRVFALPRIAHHLRPGLTPESAARTMQSMLFGLIDTWMLTPGHFDLEASGRQAIDTILHGIGLGVWAE